jgi:hypothetical protein
MLEEQKQPELNPELVARAAQLIFNSFLGHNEIPVADAHKVHPVAFLRWLSTHHYLVDDSEIAEQLGGGQAEVEFVKNLANVEGGANRLVALWPYLILSGRPNNHKLRSFQLMMLLVYDDDVVAPLSMYAHRDAVVGELDDAGIVHILTTRPAELANQVTERGLDGLHDQNEPVGIRATDGVLSLLREMVAHTAMQVGPRQMLEVQKLLDLLSIMFPGDAPDAIKQAAQQQRQQPQAPQSGWEG